MKNLRKMAIEGDRKAQAALAYNYIEGKDGFERDYYDGYYWFRRAAENGNSHAMYNLGTLYENGYGTNKDLKKALLWYKRSAENGSKLSQSKLGECYKDGKGVEKDLYEAIYWYKRACEDGDPKDLIRVYNIKGVDFYRKKEYAEAYKMFEKAVKLGDTAAKVRLGRMVLEGRGVQQDIEKGIYLLSKEVEEWGAHLLITIGNFYLERGEVEEGLYYYRKYIRKGKKAGHEALGDFYFEGVKIEKDISLALKNYLEYFNYLNVQEENLEKRAKLPHILEKLGKVYEELGEYEKAYEHHIKGSSDYSRLYVIRALSKGMGVDRDGNTADIQGDKLYREYLETENVDAYRLGILYEDGTLSQNYRRAVQLYEISAKNNVDEGIELLARMYLKGRGVVRNVEKGQMLLEKLK